MTVRLKLGLTDRSGIEGLGEGPRDDRAEPMAGPAMAPLDGGEYSSSSSGALWRPEYEWTVFERVRVDFLLFWGLV